MKYSGVAFLYLVYCFLRTRLFFQPARLIRFPIDFRGRKKMIWGKGFTTGRNCRLEAMSNKTKGPCLTIGKNVQLNDNVHIVALTKVCIGNDVLIASKVFISDCSHGVYSGLESSDPLIPPSKRVLLSAPVIIEDRVWMGDNVVVMPGITIGAGSVIGASAVVSTNIPAESIAVGIPARVIKQYNRTTQKWENIRKGLI